MLVERHHHSLLTSGSLCTTSLYVVSFFEAPLLAHGFGLFLCNQRVRGVVLLNRQHLLTVFGLFSRAISLYVMSFFEASPLAHDFRLFACHQYVRGVVL